MVDPNKPVYVTEEGLKALKDEFEELTKVRRPDLAARLSVAIKQGDLRENADYQMAKEEQGFLEGRIQELELMLRKVVVIEKDCNSNGVVTLGCEVTVAEEDYDEQETYHLVGATEADPSQGKISNESPLGQALLGHRVGDVISVSAPAGEIRFRIIEVS
ncbi:MAG: transcription elongation factor GreA [Anaerolineae bacterium]|nr:transcription elongation factor GreA [Anaerolineae bacterium]